MSSSCHKNKMFLRLEATVYNINAISKNIIFCIYQHYMITWEPTHNQNSTIEMNKKEKKEKEKFFHTLSSFSSSKVRSGQAKSLSVNNLLMLMSWDDVVSKRFTAKILNAPTYQKIYNKPYIYKFI